MDHVKVKTQLRKIGGIIPGVPDGTGPHGLGVVVVKDAPDAHRVEPNRDCEIIKRDVELEQAAIDEYQGQLPEASPKLKQILQHLIDEEEEHREELESMTEQFSKESSPYLRNKLMLIALDRESQFRKEIPAEMERMMESDPKRYQETRNILRDTWKDVGQAMDPEAAKAMQEKTKPRSWKEELQQKLVNMQPSVNTSVLSNEEAREAIGDRIIYNDIYGRSDDWSPLQKVVGDKLLRQIQSHTYFTPETFYNTLVNHGGDLGQVLADVDIIR